MFLLIILLEYFFKLQNLDFCFVEQQSYSMLVQVTCDCIRNFIKYFHKILELGALKILKLDQSQTKVRDTENISLIFSIKLFHMQMISLQIVSSEYFNKIVDFGALAILELNYRQSRATLELKTSKIFLLLSVLSYLNCILCLQQFRQNISLDYRRFVALFYGILELDQTQAYCSRHRRSLPYIGYTQDTIRHQEWCQNISTESRDLHLYFDGTLKLDQTLKDTEEIIVHATGKVFQVYVSRITTGAFNRTLYHNRRTQSIASLKYQSQAGHESLLLNNYRSFPGVCWDRNWVKNSQEFS